MDRRRLVIAAVVLLAVLHQDFWFWDDPSLVFGALPVGLAWHAGFSITAALVWSQVTRHAWPVAPAGAPGERP